MSNRQAPSAVPAAELEDVCIRRQGRLILRDVTARIEAGEFVGLVGANGAGKTTLLKVLLGVIRPVSGTVRVYGEEARPGNPHVGYTPQTRFFDRDTPLSARDLVGLGLDGHHWGFALPSPERRHLIDDALAAVDALAYADAAVGELSGGEQQRLSIAQALLTQPRLLLLDEPLASLDLRSQQEIVALVARLSRERQVAVLFVTHGLNPLLEVLDRVWYLAGTRSAIGRVEDVVRSDVLSELYGAPVEVIQASGRIFVSAAES